MIGEVLLVAAVKPFRWYLSVMLVFALMMMTDCLILQIHWGMVEELGEETVGSPS